MALIKAGIESDKRDVEGYLAIDLAPDSQVRRHYNETGPQVFGEN